jgi:hypothetical protein
MPVVPGQHRHQNIFGDRLLVAGDAAHGDAALQRGHIDQVDASGYRLQQPKARRVGKVLFPHMTDDDLRLSQRRHQALRIFDVKQHRYIELLVGLGEDRLPYPRPRPETPQKQRFHEKPENCG